MSATDTSRVRQALRELESHWISLFLWVAERTATPPDLLIADLGASAVKASENHAKEAARLGDAPNPFNVIHYLDFGNYAELASKHRPRLESLGSPPRGWLGILNQENSQGCVRYRNHLSHATRFDLLPLSEQRQAVRLFELQLTHLREWWPTCSFTPQEARTETSPLRIALRLLDTEAKDAAAFAEQLGMHGVRNPLNLIPPGETSPLAGALGGYVARLFRVGKHELRGGSVGLYLAYLDDWHERSAHREKHRRWVAKALIEHQQTDARHLVILLDEDGESPEVEFVLPRSRGAGGIGTVRATVNPRDPSRYHIELLEALRIPDGLSLPELSRRWNEAFSVERVTRRFYDEFRGVRDRLVAALLVANPANPRLAGRDPKRDKPFELQLNAFATRQLSRLLFLWFLQQKQWLGNHPGLGSRTYLIDLFRQRTGGGDAYFNDVLVPIFFEGLGRPLHDLEHQQVEQAFGDLPYLDGGLFRGDADEFERELFGMDEDGHRRHRVSLPDDLFDPVKDGTLLPGRGRAARERTVLGLLRGYRFTTQESTPDDQSVDPDPELLGKVFENLYQEDDRHETGAYYTPREIVHYMCRQALDGFLRDRAGVEQATIDWLRGEAVDWAASDRRLSGRDASALNDALDVVTVLDPAVGSGAFLVGMLQEIALLRRGIEQAVEDQDVARSSLKVAEWKRHAITHNLFGVDINPMAVEICRLRLWLSLVIDLDVKNHGRIPPLPNLDFRIVAGDSLVDRMGAEPFAHSLPRVHIQLAIATQQRIATLQDLIRNWQREFEDSGRRGDTRRLRQDAEKIRDAQIEIARTQLDHAIESARARQTQTATPAATPARSARRRAANGAGLASLERLRARLYPDAPFQKPLLWPVVFPQVFDHGGFDIVIANPPYVRQEILDPTDQEAYRHAFPEVYAGTADLLVYFFARALQVLRDGGYLAFITSNKYMRAAYGENLRIHLTTTLQVRQVIDFGDLNVFDVNAYPAVVIGRKAVVPDQQAKVQIADLVFPIRRKLADPPLPVNTDNVRRALENLPDLLNDAKVPNYPQSLLRRDVWILGHPALVGMIDRVLTHGTTVGQFTQGRVYRGLTTGLNEAFVLDRARRDDLATADQCAARLIKPWLRGRDIQRWTTSPETLYFLALQNSGDADSANPWRTAATETEARRLLLETCPAVHAHMAAFEQRLRPRADQGKFWWELRPCAYYKEFERPKVIWKKTAYRPTFAIDTSGAFLSNTVHFIPDVEPWVCAVLNSTVMEFIMVLKIPLLRGDYIELTPTRLNPLPLPTLDGAQRQRLNALVLERAAGDVTADLKIEAEVVEAYGLDDADLELINNYLAPRRLFGPANDPIAEVDGDESSD